MARQRREALERAIDALTLNVGGVLTGEWRCE
jgi:hypothetical protein